MSTKLSQKIQIDERVFEIDYDEGRIKLWIDGDYNNYCSVSAYEANRLISALQRVVNLQQEEGED